MSGDAVGARDDAARAGFKDLADKLAALDAAYSAGVAAKDARQPEVAISRYEDALRIDATITNEQGKYPRSIHRTISKLYFDVAELKFSVSDLPGARAALNSSLQHNADNAEAKAKLTELNSATRGPRAASLIPTDNGGAVRRASLLEEKDGLLASRPSLAGPIVGLVLTVVSATILVSVGILVGWSPLAIGLILGAEVVLAIICGVAIGANIGHRIRIDRRVREIDRMLERISLAPQHIELPGLIVSRF